MEPRTLRAWALAFSCAAAAGAQERPAAEPNDYGRAETWLCRPGRADACAVDLATTVVAANGKLKRESFRANARPAIDCFYVYPTVSLDKSPNSDMLAGDEERRVIRSQFARFAQECRPFAPLYRQVTLTSLRATIAGQPMAVDRALAYNDVRDAWNHYLAHDNAGRGVVLLGHSQGSGLLTQLIRNDIDGKPVQSRLVSALLLGTNLPVPRGRSSKQVGCVVTYASFRSNVPPPATSRFGRVTGDGLKAGCANPAALAGGSGPLHAYLSA